MWHSQKLTRGCCILSFWRVIVCVHKEHMKEWLWPGKFLKNIWYSFPILYCLFAMETCVALVENSEDNISGSEKRHYSLKKNTASFLDGISLVQNFFFCLHVFFFSIFYEDNQNIFWKLFNLLYYMSTPYRSCLLKNKLKYIWILQLFPSFSWVPLLVNQLAQYLGENLCSFACQFLVLCGQFGRVPFFSQVYTIILGFRCWRGCVSAELNQGSAHAYRIGIRPMNKAVRESSFGIVAAVRPGSRRSKAKWQVKTSSFSESSAFFLFHS